MRIPYGLGLALIVLAATPGLAGSRTRPMTPAAPSPGNWVIDGRLVPASEVQALIRSGGAAYDPKRNILCVRQGVGGCMWLWPNGSRLGPQELMHLGISPMGNNETPLEDAIKKLNH